MAAVRDFGKSSEQLPKASYIPNLKSLVQEMPELLAFEKRDGRRRRHRRRRQTEDMTTI